MPAGSLPETRGVRGANLCRIAVHRPLNRRTVVVLSVIDNLVKGAAGQALQNFNIMHGLDEKAGLDGIALQP
jgi:N-acetyl-gamma-glutamyl-phosphate reductase